MPIKLTIQRSLDRLNFIQIKSMQKELERLLVVFVGFLVGKSERRKDRLWGLGGAGSEEENVKNGVFWWWTRRIPAELR
ncbi:hypothetical protein H5410_062689 [Solanum commersonii]|uniref:Uncharacterized protein n=1 Tax=Solanum commersonii TaxID=4109 RepID=A0A9J5WB29_SOLCO|nr:hypothetical protein H5410_062689 [Solanum commersonii]